ncbi:ABC transporter permease [bacterium]|nr:ABC transporter permease [bacterium]MBU1633162.1 ABC transporter permease [bacterium]MBU1873869.1 ABC transporter permease [bacterium]
MFKNYLKIAVRNLIRHKTYSFINIAGLAIGMASCFLILLYVLDEMCYDRYHENAKQIYRILNEDTGNEEFYSTTPFVLAPTLINDFPEVTKITRMVKNLGEIMVKQDENFIRENNLFFADQDIFDIFTFSFIKGNSKTALVEPYSIVITKKMAEKYFGDKDPMEKILTIKVENDLYDLKVAGVLKDIPRNSHFRADFIASMIIARNIFEKMEERFGFSILENWGFNNPFTYLLLPDNYPASKLEQKLPDFKKRHVPDWLNIKYHLQPLTDIHLHSTHVLSDIEVQGNITYVYLFSAIALLILLIACINFIILSTARSATRAKEVGVRKVIGASRSDVIKQILSESVLVSFISLPIAISLVEFFLPFANQLLRTKLTVNYYENWQFIISLILITFIVGITSGSYISFYLSSFQPVEILKRKLKPGQTKSNFRRILIIMQLSIYTMLIFCTGSIYRQLYYLQNKDLGFDKEHVVVINIPNPEFLQKYESFKNEVIQNSGIINISGAWLIPPTSNRGTAQIYPKNDPDNKKTIGLNAVDYNYFETLNIEFATGRSFSIKFSTDEKEAVIINETAAREFGFKSPIGEKIKDFGNREIIGVVKDFHLRSLYERIEPCMFVLNPMEIYQVMIRIRPGNIPETLFFLKEKWKQFVPIAPFNYSFIDDNLNKLYESEQRAGKIIGYFTFLAILIASLGLFGLASFIAEQRTKEIGIRKVFGASVPVIVALLSKEIVKLTIIAIIIAFPVVYYAMNRWLQDFAYRINIGFGTFILTGLVALAIALFTVIFQAVKAATVNPVETLRYE